jgi:hypothetical protein
VPLLCCAVWCCDVRLCCAAVLAAVHSWCWLACHCAALCRSCAAALRWPVHYECVTVPGEARPAGPSACLAACRAWWCAACCPPPRPARPPSSVLWRLCLWFCCAVAVTARPRTAATALHWPALPWPPDGPGAAGGGRPAGCPGLLPCCLGRLALAAARLPWLSGLCLCCCAWVWPGLAWDGLGWAGAARTPRGGSGRPRPHGHTTACRTALTATCDGEARSEPNGSGLACPHYERSVLRCAALVWRAAPCSLLPSSP